MKQRLKQMLRLTFGFALLRSHPIKLLDDARKFFLERKRRQREFDCR